MDTKLTLRLDKEVIDKAKEYASSQKRSLSGLIESYLKSLTSNEDFNRKDEIQISAFVKSLATGVHMSPDFDYKEEYAKHLEEKHK